MLDEMTRELRAHIEGRLGRVVKQPTVPPMPGAKSKSVTGPAWPKLPSVPEEKPKAVSTAKKEGFVANRVSAIVGEGAPVSTERITNYTEDRQEVGAT